MRDCPVHTSGLLNPAREALGCLTIFDLASEDPLDKLIGNGCL